MGWFSDVVGTVVDPFHIVHGDSDANNSIDDTIRRNQVAMPQAPDPNALIPDRTSELDARMNRVGNPWTQFATNQSDLQTQSAQDSAASRAAAGAASARSTLASRGGLSGGSAERLAGAGAENGLQASADISRQGMSNDLGISARGQEMNLQGANSWSQMAQNMDNNRAGIAGSNYGNAMKAWGANQTANADLAGSKSKGILANLWG